MATKKSTKTATEKKAKKTIEIRVPENYTHQELLDQLTLAVFKKLKTEHTLSKKVRVDFQKQIPPRAQ